MGFLLVIALVGLTTTALYLIGYQLWVLIALCILWIAAIVYSLVCGHRGFGGGGNTDLNVVVAGFIITAVIVIPKHHAQKPCNQARDALRKVAAAEGEYYSKYSTYTADIGALHLERKPRVAIMIHKGDMQSFTATAAHESCDENGDGHPDQFTWDSATGGLK
jgi:hypothetical protein